MADMGERHPQWKGNDAGYVALHQRVYARRGKADRCVWGCVAKRYDWANLTGDYTDVNDYAMMCRSCHRRFESATQAMEPGFRATRRDAKLSVQIVQEARERKARGATYAELAREYGVHWSTLRAAIIGTEWRWA